MGQGSSWRGCTRHNLYGFNNISYLRHHLHCAQAAPRPRSRLGSSSCYRRRRGSRLLQQGLMVDLFEDASHPARTVG